MTLEVLLSCMHQQDMSIVHRTRIAGDAVVINQCDRVAFSEVITERGRARCFSVTERGLTRSRNRAIENAEADVCLLCDDDECLAENYVQLVLQAYKELPQADVIVFQVENTPAPFGDRSRRLRFPLTMKVRSVQLSFRRDSLRKSGVHFDPLLGAGSGNGAEEELKFLLDCQRAGLQIWYAPVKVAALLGETSTWFSGFHEEFFENRGATTRYILGAVPAFLYAVYYVCAKRNLYRSNLTPIRALKATLRGIRNNKISKQAEQERKV